MHTDRIAGVNASLVGTEIGVQTKHKCDSTESSHETRMLQSKELSDLLESSFRSMPHLFRHRSSTQVTVMLVQDCWKIASARQPSALQKTPVLVSHSVDPKCMLEEPMTSTEEMRKLDTIGILPLCVAVHHSARNNSRYHDRKENEYTPH